MRPSNVHEEDDEDEDEEEEVTAPGTRNVEEEKKEKRGLDNYHYIALLLDYCKSCNLTGYSTATQ